MAELLVVVIPPPVPCVGLTPKALTLVFQRMFDVLLTLGHPAPVEGIFHQVFQAIIERAIPPIPAERLILG
ncbi:hypothetical protein M5689_024533 [Euphorbia peplus]|nr:hypothetical protein M5689_024533 [Euphorbia peplus]